MRKQVSAILEFEIIEMIKKLAQKWQAPESKFNGFVISRCIRIVYEQEFKQGE